MEADRLATIVRGIGGVKAREVKCSTVGRQSPAALAWAVNRNREPLRLQAH